MLISGCNYCETVPFSFLKLLCKLTLFTQFLFCEPGFSILIFVRGYYPGKLAVVEYFVCVTKSFSRRNKSVTILYRITMPKPATGANWGTPPSTKFCRPSMTLQFQASIAKEKLMSQKWQILHPALAKLKNEKQPRAADFREITPRQSREVRPSEYFLADVFNTGKKNYNNNNNNTTTHNTPTNNAKNNNNAKNYGNNTRNYYTNNNNNNNKYNNAITNIINNTSNSTIANTNTNITSASSNNNNNIIINTDTNANVRATTTTTSTTTTNNNNNSTNTNTNTNNIATTTSSNTNSSSSSNTNNNSSSNTNTTNNNTNHHTVTSLSKRRSSVKAGRRHPSSCPNPALRYISSLYGGPTPKLFSQQQQQQQQPQPSLSLSLASSSSSVVWLVMPSTPRTATTSTTAPTTSTTATPLTTMSATPLTTMLRTSLSQNPMMRSSSSLSSSSPFVATLRSQTTMLQSNFYNGRQTNTIEP